MELELRQLAANGRPMPTQKERMEKTWLRLSPQYRTTNQSLGQRITIGCVSLEITQRCNLDCELCYLSEMSENTLDIPMEEVKRRIDEIYYHYGPATGVQVSGGDPTLRKREELIEIVRYIASVGMQPALFTNGIKADRALLEELATVGLTDIAFHVDMTQQLRRPDKTYYQSEKELNTIRKQYVERVRGLGVAIIFNTTLCSKNFHELPVLVQFFKENADVVGMCSFQLQADTGRGVLSGRPDDITPPNVRRIINENLEHPINFDVIDIGHTECNRVGYSFICNKHAYDLWWDSSMIHFITKEFEGLTLDRGKPNEAIITVLKHAATRPRLIARGLKFLATHVWRMKWDLLASGFKVYKLSFFIHNFMHADCLDQERIDNCSFMVMTADGPMSMCQHNAERDLHITKSFVVNIEGIEQEFNPVRPQKRRMWEEKKATLLTEKSA